MCVLMLSTIALLAASTFFLERRLSNWPVEDLMVDSFMGRRRIRSEMTVR